VYIDNINVFFFFFLIALTEHLFFLKMKNLLGFSSVLSTSVIDKLKILTGMVEIVNCGSY
jgi:hypothetical protein